MAKRDTGEYRLDIKVPSGMYEQIEELAKDSGARVHHISKRPIVKDVVLEILAIGIKHYGDGLPDSNTRNVSDTELIDDRIKAAIAPLMQEVTDLKKPLPLC